MLRKATGLSQEDFARKAFRSRSEIKNIEYGKTEPKDEVISAVCKAHGANEEWLRSGLGEPFAPKTREEEVAELVGKAFNDADNNFRLSIIRTICSRTDKELEVLESALRTIYEDIQKDATE